MKSCTDVMSRRPLAAAIAMIRTTNPIGSNHSRLNHRLCPIRTRGAMPCATGTEPAHVLGSTTSSPTVSCDRKLATTSGVTLASGAAGRSAGGSVGSRPACGRPSPPPPWFTVLRSVIRAPYGPSAQPHDASNVAGGGAR